MRLSPEQTRVILTTIRSHAGPDARVVLFGSRVDDQRRGGDIDLLVESTPPLSLIQRAKIKYALESALGLPVDILSKQADTPPKPFQTIALATGVQL